MDDVKNNMKKMGIICYRKIAGVVDVWKLIVKEAKLLHGPQTHWRRGRRMRRRRRNRRRIRRILRW